MVVPNQERTDNTVATITIGLDGLDTKHWKPFKCAMCGGTVFKYKDSLRFMLPIDSSEFYGEEKFEELSLKDAQALDQVECTHYVRGYGARKRCGTIYVLLRGNFKVSEV